MDWIADFVELALPAMGRWEAPELRGASTGIASASCAGMDDSNEDTALRDADSREVTGR